MLKQEQKTSVKVEVKVSPASLPLCCPLPSMTLWNMHPRVYLPVDNDGEAVCPYCDTRYIVCDE